MKLSSDALYTLAHRSNDTNSGASFKFEVTGTSEVHLQAAIAMLMASHAGTTDAKGLGKMDYFEVGKYSLSFMFFGQHITPKKGYQQLPFPLDVVGVAQMAQSWLDQLTDRPSEPDHDGSNSPGWRVASEAGPWDELRIEFWWAQHHK